MNSRSPTLHEPETPLAPAKIFEGGTSFQPVSTAARDRYIRNQMHGVPGFLATSDALLINCMLAWQDRHAIPGNLCEIDVHHGRSFLLLALARRPGETALAIDLFEDDELNATGSHAGRNGALQRHARRLRVPLAAREILKRSSIGLKPLDILERTGGPIRLFSIDGGHRYVHVANDLTLAVPCMQECGIIAVDDFFNPDWPEVSLATMEFLRSHHEFVPFLFGANKLYLCPASMADTLREDIVQSRPRGSRPAHVADFFESRYAVIGISLADRLWERLRQKLRM